MIEETTLLHTEGMGLHFSKFPYINNSLPVSIVVVPDVLFYMHSSYKKGDNEKVAVPHVQPDTV